MSFCSEVFPSQSSSSSEVSIETQLQVINNALNLLHESPVPSKKLLDRRYLERKVNQITCNLRKLFRLDNDSQPDQNINLTDFQNLIDRLKIKFNDESTSTGQKIQILTLLPSEWSERKICDVMNSSRYMVQVAKKLSKTVGILSKPETKLGIVM